MARMSFRVAPGVRMSVSSRGVRTSLGNSTARVSFGGGSTYTSARVAGVRVSQYHSSPRTTLGQLERANNAATLDEQLAQLAEIERRLVTLHHESFAPAAPRAIPLPALTDITRRSRELQKLSVKGINIFKRAERREARAAAHATAIKEGHARDLLNAEAYKRELQEAQADWERLVGHDVPTVLTALEEAFADNGSESTCIDVGVEDGARYATVVVLFGPAAMVPDRTPGFTPTGRPTAKRRTKSERNALYVDALGSTVLATVREGFAVAPSLDSIRTVVLRRDPDASTPAEFLTAIYSASFDRAGAAQVDWRSVEPGQSLLTANQAEFRRRGAAADVVSLDLKGRLDLQQIVEQFRAAIA